MEQGWLKKQSKNGLQVYVATGKKGCPDLTRYTTQHAVKTRELNKMLRYAVSEKPGCRMSILRRIWGDSTSDQCGRCCLCQPSTISIPKTALSCDPLFVDQPSRRGDRCQRCTQDSAAGRFGRQAADADLRSFYAAEGDEQRRGAGDERGVVIFAAQIPDTSRGAAADRAVVALPSRTWRARALWRHGSGVKCAPLLSSICWHGVSLLRHVRASSSITTAPP